MSDSTVSSPALIERPLPFEVATPPLVPTLRRMADQVRARWSRANQDESAFPDIALQAMKDFAVGEVDPAQLVAWAVSVEQFPSQADIDSPFGEPALTIHVGNGFQIELLFWLDGTTTIHQHMFSGAFQVLLGSSLHTQFSFTRERRINSRLQLGKLRFSASELLERGAIRPIFAGDRLIHSLFHLDRPSLTLVVRTRREEEAGLQFDYLPPGIALDGSSRGAAFRRRVQLLRMLKRLRHPGFGPSLQLMLAKSDLETRFRLLTHPDLLSGPDVRDQLSGRPDDEAVRDWLLAAYDDSQRVHNLVLWRQALPQPDLRFLLGLLLNVPSREGILRLVGQRCSGDPLERIMGWIAELWQVQRGIRDFPPIIDHVSEEPDRQMLRGLLAGEGRASDVMRRSAFFRALLD